MTFSSAVLYILLRPDFGCDILEDQMVLFTLLHPGFPALVTILHMPYFLSLPSALWSLSYLCFGSRLPLSNSLGLSHSRRHRSFSPKYSNSYFQSCLALSHTQLCALCPCFLITHLKSPPVSRTLFNRNWNFRSYFPPFLYLSFFLLLLHGTVTFVRSWFETIQLD